MHASITFIAPITFVFTHSKGLYSAVGTILVAAACTTQSTPSIALYNRSRSLTSPRKNLHDHHLILFAKSHCFISSRERIIIFWIIFFKSHLDEFLAERTVPPVTKIFAPVSIKIPIFNNF